jgi:murein DD-endopeptidase MepM/ murein hydrolase activator NlpD
MGRVVGTARSEELRRMTLRRPEATSGVIRTAPGSTRRRVLTLGVAALVLLGAVAGAADPAAEPTVSAEAWAVSVVVPGRPGASTKVVSAPPSASPVDPIGFVYPDEGTVVVTVSSGATATVDEGASPSAEATSSASGIVVFGGEITIDAVSAQARAKVAGGKASGGFEGSSVTNLLVFGAPVSGSAALGDWGTLTVDARNVESTTPGGAPGYSGSVTAVAIRLTAEHGGLPAGSEILIGHAEAVAEPATEGTTTPVPGAKEPAGGPSRPAPPSEPPAKPAPPYLPIPNTLLPSLDAGPYVFPVFGDASYGDGYGDLRQNVTYHHGNDIFGELGQPLVAVTDGTVFSVGWNKVGGNRLWLRDRQGNVFYYAHLSAFSTLVFNGERVRAGQVVGFMGTTGDAESTIPHLHFEVHPVSLLYLGYDGAVDPSPYLADWRRLGGLPYPMPTGWAPRVPGSGSAPQPGAILLSVSDISSAEGLDPQSLLRAIEAPPRP